MKKSKYSIRKDTILSGSLVDLNNPSAPSGSIVYNTNVTGSLVTGYYQYNGDSWNIFTGSIKPDYQLPIYLDAKAKELGSMMPFDGNVYQTAEPNVTANFLYTYDTNGLTIYNTTDYSQLKNNSFPEVVYTINWGNGDISNITANGSITYSNYILSGIYKVQITLDAPWIQETTTKFVYVQSNSNTCRILNEDEIIIDDEAGNYLNREDCGP